MRYCYVNGDFVTENQAHILSQDRGFLLADGLFTTLRCYKGKPFLLKAHWQRLFQGSKQLNIPFYFSYEDMEKICFKLITLNDFSARDSSLRITLTRGQTKRRGLLIPSQIETVPSFIVQNHPIEITQSKPISLTFSDDYRIHPTPLTLFKTLNYVERIMARQKAIEQGFDDVVLLNSTNEIVSTSCANIFLVRQRQLYTPQLMGGAVDGIMRSLILKLVKQMNYPVYCTSLRLSDLRNAEEVFLTNSLIEIQPSIRFQQVQFPIEKQGQITTLLQTSLQEYIHKRI